MAGSGGVMADWMDFATDGGWSPWETRSRTEGETSPAMKDDMSDAHVEFVKESASWRGQSVRVSATLITYNQDRFVEDALRSILAQTYPVDLVISDDASQDGTVAIIASVLRSSVHRHRVRFRRGLRNLGVCGNQNAAISLTEGELVVLFEGDDVSAPGRVGRLVEAYGKERGRVAALGSAMTIVDGTGRPIRTVSWPLLHGDVHTLAAGGWEVHGCTLAFRSDCYFGIGPISRHLISGDIALWMRGAFAWDGGLVQVPESLVRYRVHGDNVGSSYALNYASREALRRACQRLVKNEIAQVFELDKIRRYRQRFPTDPVVEAAWNRLRRVAVARARLALAIARRSPVRWLPVALAAARFRQIRPLALRALMLALAPWLYPVARATIGVARRGLCRTQPRQ